jgi:hypothetical protein
LARTSIRYVGFLILHIFFSFSFLQQRLHFPMMGARVTYSLVFSSFTLASFLAVGPPAAPPLGNLGIANRFNESQLYDEFDSLTANSRFVHSNLTAFADQTEAATFRGGGYFWLADASTGHKVWTLSTSQPISKC